MREYVQHVKKIHIVLFVSGIVLLFCATGAFLVDRVALRARLCELSAESNSCFLTLAHSLYESQGAAKSLSVIHHTIVPRYGYTTAHIMFHIIGDHAYEELSDLNAVFALANPYVTSFTGEHLDGWDGFYHGAIIAYFLSQPSKDVPLLVENLCGLGTKLPGLITSDRFFCHHTVGHAILHHVGGSIEKAVAACDTLPDAMARDGCYYGIFMEQTFLQNPEYRKHIGSEFDTRNMLTLCGVVHERAAFFCASFIAAEYLANHEGDVAGAFHECDRDVRWQSRCREWTYLVIIPSLARGDREEIRRMCAIAGESQTSTCRSLAENGLTF